MGMVMCALAVNVIISLIIPLVLIIVLWVKHPVERKKIFLLSIAGMISYIGMQWGVKEHGLAYLFNHTKFQDFMNAHYIPYLLVVAFAGAVLALLPELLIALVFCRRQLSFCKVIAWGLAYGATESVMLVGFKSFWTIIEWVKGNGDQEISTTAGELFLSGYERILMMLIEIAILMVLVYFVQQKKTIQGSVIQLICHTFVTFLPGFFIAFSTSNYYEVFDRSTTLVFVYVILTVAAVCSLALLSTMQYSIKDGTVE